MDLFSEKRLHFDIMKFTSTSNNKIWYTINCPFSAKVLKPLIKDKSNPVLAKFVKHLAKQSDCLNVAIVSALFNQDIHEFSRFINELKLVGASYSLVPIFNNEVQDKNILGSLFKEITGNEPGFEYTYTDIITTDKFNDYEMSKYVIFEYIFLTQKDAEEFLRLLIRRCKAISDKVKI